MVARTMQGFEAILCDELKAIGATDVKDVVRAVEFEGDLSVLYKANVHCRTALRILKPIASFRAKNEEQLYRNLKKIRWSEFFTVDQTFAVDKTVNSPHFKHSGFAALKCKDAIVDHFREIYDQRPNVKTMEPDLMIHLHISLDRVNISIDSSGRSLNQRGYRIDGGVAPLNEVLAAGLILLSGWDQKTTFIDPMCGSGTIVTEAAMIATNTAPGLLNGDFGFQFWNDYDEKLYDKVMEEAEAMVTKPRCRIIGSDESKTAMGITRENLEEAELLEYVTLERSDFFNRDAKNAFIVTNPPYGERMQMEEMIEFYQTIGDHLKQKCENCTAWFISSNIKALKRIGLRPSKKIPLRSGALDCGFYKFEVFSGSMKEKKTNEAESKE